MLDLKHVTMQATIDENNNVTVRFYIFDKDGKRKPLNIEELSRDDLKYVKARFSVLLHKTANQWGKIFKD